MWVAGAVTGVKVGKDERGGGGDVAIGCGAGRQGMANVGCETVGVDETTFALIRFAQIAP